MKSKEEQLRKKDTIETKRLLLRRFQLEDKQDLLEYASQEETLRYLTWEGVQTLEQAMESIQGYYQTQSGCFAIILKETKKCIGAIEIRLEEEHDKADFGYMLNSRFWNKGYMTEALLGIFEFAFETLQLNRIEGTHHLKNPASGKVMQKCGMQKEGIGIQEKKIKGEFWDVVHYAILKEEWKEKGQNIDQG